MGQGKMDPKERQVGSQQHQVASFLVWGVSSGNFLILDSHLTFPQFPLDFSVLSLCGVGRSKWKFLFGHPTLPLSIPAPLMPSNKITLTQAIPFFVAYVQGIGRAGRDGHPSKAILHFNNSDIGPQKEHMSDAIREYCRTTSCRRKYICNYFDMEPTLIRSKHLCCDNCASECDCELCELANVSIPDTTDAAYKKVSDSVKKIAQQVLISYFSEENKVTLPPEQLVPHLSTGLSTDLAHQISNDDSVYNTANCTEYLAEVYPHLTQNSVKNISALISKVAELHLS